MGSIWLGAFVGFLVVLVLGFLFPGIGHTGGSFISGIVAGLIMKSAGRGLIAGFLAGIFGGIIIAILAIVGLAIVGGVATGFAGALFRS